VGLVVVPAIAVADLTVTDKKITSVWQSSTNGQVSLAIPGLHAQCVYGVVSYDRATNPGKAVHGVAIAAQESDAYVDVTYQLHIAPGAWVGACMLKTLTLK
jgi:hypothetical protein